MKLAIIGCGSIGTRHLRNALTLGCEVLVYDRDRHREREAMLLGAAGEFRAIDVRTFSQPDARAMWPSVDAIVVCTPHDQHLAWVQQAIDRRVPVFCEKPLGSLDQLEEWRALVKASENVISQVGYQCRFHPKYRAMREWCAEPTSGGFYTDCDMRTWPGDGYGSMLLELSHDLDLALASGAPLRLDKVSATSISYDIWLGDEERWLVSLYGESQTYRRHWALASHQADVILRFDTPAALGDQMYVAELDHFLSCVRDGRQTDVPLADGLRVLEVCAQIEAMAKVSA